MKDPVSRREFSRTAMAGGGGRDRGPARPVASSGRTIG